MKHDKGGHRSRVRERYRREGIESFQDYEVLELLLYYCYPRCDTKQIAKDMLRGFGSLSHLFDADVETLQTRLNCTENIAVFLTLMPAIAKRYSQDKWRKKIEFNDPKTAGEYAQSLFIGQTTERFYVISLDARNRLNHTALISKGTLNESAIYPREVVKAAVENNAAAVILAHNHPAGTLKPSQGDYEITRVITEGLSFINVAVLDHIIVAGETYYSFAARGHHVAGYGK
ncbi:MAG: DNA repair protein RadC [Defluviitaleaceae bacterium]|nr:DNA repair protein RadC [Defluviitaleaceae bacterium]MCL2275025.1 DNA repair protein RadC [Defluviitaleaceae bacterium]